MGDAINGWEFLDMHLSARHARKHELQFITQFMIKQCINLFLLGWLYN